MSQLVGRALILGCLVVLAVELPYVVQDWRLGDGFVEPSLVGSDWFADGAPAIEAVGPELLLAEVGLDSLALGL